MTSPRALALVESPAQLLNVMELAQFESGPAEVPIAVLAPTAGPTRTQLRSMVQLARETGHTVSWHEPRLGGAAVARTVRALSTELGGVEQLIVGDPFSGVIQVIISVSRAAEVTVVDDGTATLEFVRQWTAGEHLSRWHQRATPSQRRHIATLARDQIAGSARRRLSPAFGSRLRLFSCLSVSLPGVLVLPNRFAWTRESFGPPRTKNAADLIGTSLVETGVVRAEQYLAGVESLIGRHGVDRYFAHRKEAGWKLDLIARMGVEVVRPLLPLEIVARRGPVGRRMLSFPSTVVHTLPLVLAGSGVELEVCAIPDDWYSADVTSRADAFLTEVAGSARQHFGLAAVAC